MAEVARLWARPEAAAVEAARGAAQQPEVAAAAVQLLVQQAAAVRLEAVEVQPSVARAEEELWARRPAAAPSAAASACRLDQALAPVRPEPG